MLLFFFLLVSNLILGFKLGLKNKVLSYTTASLFVPILIAVIINFLICTGAESYVCSVNIGIYWLIIQPLVLVIAQLFLKKYIKSST